MARTGDHTKIIVAANDASGELAIFDANGSAIIGPRSLGAGTVPLVAVNIDGTRVAVQFVAAAQVSSFCSTPRSTKSLHPSSSTRKAWPSRATETSSTPAKTPPALR